MCRCQQKEHNKSKRKSQWRTRQSCLKSCHQSVISSCKETWLCLIHRIQKKTIRWYNQSWDNLQKLVTLDLLNLSLLDWFWSWGSGTPRGLQEKIWDKTNAKCFLPSRNTKTNMHIVTKYISSDLLPCNILIVVNVGDVVLF